MPKIKSVETWLIIISLVYLALILVIPAVSVFYEAFHRGIQPFLEALQQREFGEAVKLTIVIAVVTVPLNTIFGLCAGWVIARNEFRGKTFLMSLIDLPFSISPVVAGLMLVLLYGRNGWFGGLLGYDFRYFSLRR
jgi:sulfate/thiosulfate transport system permease protein